MGERKVALVTGAATGIGAATVRAFAARGLDVAINHLGESDIANARTTAGLCREAGVRADLAQADVGSPEQCRALIDRVVTEFGRIDYLVNNAGYTKGRPLNDLDSVEPIEFERSFAVNCMGPFYLTPLRSTASAVGGSRRNRQHCVVCWTDRVRQLPSLLCQ
jgi:3-oxoacyl-[acyl-carrier protein] reductase